MHVRLGEVRNVLKKAEQRDPEEQTDREARREIKSVFKG